MGVIYRVDLTNAADYEVFAQILAVLARPGAHELDKRMELFHSLCSWMIRDRAARDQAWAGTCQLIKPIYLAWPEANIKRDMRTLERRLRDRLTAGHMALLFLKAPQDHQPSLVEACKSVTSALGIECPKNVENRVWRPSIPVLHLCAAFAVTVAERARLTGVPLPINEWETDPHFLPDVLVRASHYEELLAKCALRIDSGRLIQLRPAPGSRFKKIA